MYILQIMHIVDRFIFWIVTTDYDRTTSNRQTLRLVREDAA